MMSKHKLYHVCINDMMMFSFQNESKAREFASLAWSSEDVKMVEVYYRGEVIT